MLTASYMLESGAAALVLLGRSGRCANAADMRMLADEGCAACVTLLRADVSGRSEADHAISTACRASVPLGGLLHAAGLQARHPLSLPRTPWSSGPWPFIIDSCSLLLWVEEHTEFQSHATFEYLLFDSMYSQVRTHPFLYAAFF